MSEESLVKNTADPEQVQKAKEKELRGRELEISDLGWLLSSVKGRRFLWRLFEFAGINRLSYNAVNINETNFNEGMRNVANKVLADVMETRPEAYIEMINENKKEGK